MWSPQSQYAVGIGAGVGALLGSALGAAIDAGSKRGRQGKHPRVTDYEVPICQMCLELVSERELAAVAGLHRLVRSVNTPVLQREIVDGAILVTFRNEDYALAFREANGARVSDSVEALKASGSSASRTTSSRR
jgi:hypothetical protein